LNDSHSGSKATAALGKNDNTARCRPAFRKTSGELKSGTVKGENEILKALSLPKIFGECHKAACFSCRFRAFGTLARQGWKMIAWSIYPKAWSIYPKAWVVYPKRSFFESERGRLYLVSEMGGANVFTIGNPLFLFFDNKKTDKKAVFFVR